MLITLGIIGVVAALTIPALISSYQEQVYKTAYKKANSIISQASNKFYFDNGGNIKGLYSTPESFKEEFKTYFKYTKDCSTTSTYGGTGNGASADGCWHLANQWKTMQNVGKEAISDSGLVLNDGMMFFMSLHYPNCDFDMTSYNDNFSRCGFLNIDTNGFKGPNMGGKDIFNFNILQDKIIPEGSQAVDSSKVCLSTGDGWDCGIKYLTN